MTSTSQKLWPYQPKFTIIIAITLVILLILLTGLLRHITGWPAYNSSNTIIIGILILSLLPFILSIMDTIMEKGGTIGYKDFKIEFTKVQLSGPSGFTIPANIGVPGIAVSDSDTPNILQHLRQASASSIVVIDLEDGHAWWETRLLVLVSGAERLGRPDKIVFVGDEPYREQVFMGWAKPADILRQLLKENEQYQKSFHRARISARQWQLMLPREKLPGQTYYPMPQPPFPPHIDGNLSHHHAWMAFSQETGLPNELLTEQLFQHELGETIEKQAAGAKHINPASLHSIFSSVLITESIDSQQTSEQQMATLFSGDCPSIALTQNKKYIGLVSRQTLYNEAFKNIFNHSKPTR